MAFQRLSKPATSGASAAASVTLGRDEARGGVTWISINKAARLMMGDPAAVALAWDDEACVLRIFAASPEDVDSYSIGKATGRISVTRILRQLGIKVTDLHRIGVTRAGRTSIDVDLSDMPTEGLHPLRAVS